MKVEDTLILAGGVEGEFWNVFFSMKVGDPLTLTGGVEGEFWSVFFFLKPARAFRQNFWNLRDALRLLKIFSIPKFIFEFHFFFFIRKPARGNR